MKVLLIEIKDGVPLPPPGKVRAKDPAWKPPGRPGPKETIRDLEPGQCAEFDTASHMSVRVMASQVGEATGNRYAVRLLGEGDGPGISRIGVWRIDGTQYDMK